MRAYRNSRPDTSSAGWFAASASRLRRRTLWVQLGAVSIIADRPPWIRILDSRGCTAADGVLSSETSPLSARASTVSRLVGGERESRLFAMVRNGRHQSCWISTTKKSRLAARLLRRAVLYKDRVGALPRLLLTAAQRPSAKVGRVRLRTSHTCSPLHPCPVPRPTNNERPRRDMRVAIFFRRRSLSRYRG